MQILITHIYTCRKQAKQIQEQLKESQNGKNYSLKASSTMAKSESLVKSHVQLQNVSHVSVYLFLQPTSAVPSRGKRKSMIILIFSVLYSF